MDDLSQHPTYHSCLYKRMSWTAIFVGALIGTGLGFLLHLFGIAIGLSAFSLTPDGATAVAIGGIVGMLIGVIASMLAAGYARWSRYLVIDFSHPWPKSTRQRAKCLAPTVLRPARCPERASVCLPQ